MNFLEKNKFIVKHTDVDYLVHDISLLKTKQASSSLIDRASKAIPFNKKRIAEEILLTLLESFTPKEILKNRTQDLPSKVNLAGTSLNAIIVDEANILDNKVKRTSNKVLDTKDKSKKKRKRKKNFRK